MILPQKKQTKQNSRRNFGQTNGLLYVTVTKNNTILTLTNLQNEVLAWTTCQNCGFAGTEKATEIATITTAEEMGLRVLDRKIKRVDLIFQGKRRRRKDIVRGLIRSKLKISNFIFKTFAPYNGCRAKKRRRV